MGIYVKRNSLLACHTQVILGEEYFFYALGTCPKEAMK